MGPAHSLHSSHPEDVAGRFYLKTNTSECFLFLVTFTTSHCQIFGECGKVWEESESHLLPITQRQSLRKAESCLLARSRGRACAWGPYACAVCGCVCLHGVHVCTNGVRVRACGVRARCAWRAWCAWRAAWVVSARAPRPPRRKATRFSRSHVPARPSGRMTPDRSQSPARRRRRAERQQVVPGDGGPVMPATRFGGARRTRTGASDRRAGLRAGRSRVGAPRAPSFLPGRVCLPASRTPEPHSLKPLRHNNTPQTTRLKQALVPPDLVPAGLGEACPARVPQLLRGRVPWARPPTRWSWFTSATPRRPVWVRTSAFGAVQPTAVGLT